MFVDLYVRCSFNRFLLFSLPPCYDFFNMRCGYQNFHFHLRFFFKFLTFAKLYFKNIDIFISIFLGKKWKESRSVLDVALNTSLLSEYYLEIFIRQSKILMEELMQVEQGQSINLLPYVLKGVITSICGKHRTNRN